MPSFPFKKPLLPVFAALFLLSACSVLPGYEKKNSEMAAQSIKGPYRQAERNRPLSPEEQHALARAQVEPHKMVQHNAYVKNVKQMKAEEKARKRALEMEREIRTAASSFKGLKDRVERAGVVQALSGPGGSVQNFRIGEYPDKTRIVLDFDAPAEFAFDMDTSQGLLVIRLSSKQWNAPTERLFKNNPVLQAYAAKISKNGQALVAVKLKGPGKVLYSEKLGRNAAGYYRIFFDIALL